VPQVLKDLRAAIHLDGVMSGGLYWIAAADQDTVRTRYFQQLLRKGKPVRQLVTTSSHEGFSMHSEQRIAIRKKITLDILINYEHYDVSFPRLWKTRDLSACGAFVEMRHIELPADAHIEAVLVLEYQENHEPHSLPAEVVRVSGDGIALRFGRYTERTYAALCLLLENSH
jgi:hypothetical protein